MADKQSVDRDTKSGIRRDPVTEEVLDDGRLMPKPEPKEGVEDEPSS